MPPRANIADIAQRATAVGLFGLSVWGIWLAGAMFMSRRGEQGVQQPPTQLLAYGSQARKDAEARDALLKQAKMQGNVREPPKMPS